MQQVRNGGNITDITMQPTTNNKGFKKKQNDPKGNVTVTNVTWRFFSRLVVSTISFFFFPMPGMLGAQLTSIL